MRNASTATTPAPTGTGGGSGRPPLPYAPTEVPGRVDAADGDAEGVADGTWLSRRLAAALRPPPAAAVTAASLSPRSLAVRLAAAKGLRGSAALAWRDMSLPPPPLLAAPPPAPAFEVVDALGVEFAVGRLVWVDLPDRTLGA